MPKKKQFKRNILLVCEGELTEPNYFHFLKQKALEARSWDVIDIFPKLREEPENNTASKQHNARKKRQFKETERPIEEADEVEKQYKWMALPTRYIKECRDKLKEKAYDEVWAVFDKDGHPYPQEAFELAKNTIEGKIVNIAFSSISFETWLLLHFERCNIAFEKTSCKNKDNNKQYVACGTGVAHDCKGSLCIAGYLREKTYIEDFSKKLTVKHAEDLHNNLENALINAAWLRATSNENDAPAYTTNPYTDVDVLVRRLFPKYPKTIWQKPNEIYTHKNRLSIRVVFEEDSTVVTFKNSGTTSLMITATDYEIFVDEIVFKYAGSLLSIDTSMSLSMPKSNTVNIVIAADTSIYFVQDYHAIVSPPLLKNTKKTLISNSHSHRKP